MTKPTFALAVLGLALSGCATSPADWQGADAEKTYDKMLEAKRVAELYNNDDYWQVEKEGRIYAFSEQKAYQSWLKTGEIPLLVTKIGGGPNGETLKLQLSKADAKAMESKVGYKGAAQRMFEGDLKGVDVGFYGEIVTETRMLVFSDWKDLDSYRKTKDAPCGVTNVGGGPEGRTVVFVQSCKAAAAGKPDVAMTKFKSTYGLQ
ncbi:MAG TPA: hypothetical protein VJM11_19900 [Nevskiaceae bacterium]|nr:hypothetical protein [Nevskiaceae bacterium]